MVHARRRARVKSADRQDAVYRRAVRFEPRGQQFGLMPIKAAGEIIDPANDDFYQRLIIHRNAIKSKLEAASDADKPALKSDEQGIKILANATSYGIFLELNVEEYVTAKPMIGYGGRPESLKFKSKSREKTGAYFHPLLGTLITGAARLMLALAEHQVIEQGLDWTFVDTDSIAIANTRNLAHDEFIAAASKVRDWFKDLNPYGDDRSILQLEKVNFPIGRDGTLDALDPPQCLAVSAKRYVLFNRTEGGVVVRKASGHGLGYLMAPYDETPAERRERIERIGVPLWQEDLWKEIIRAELGSARPDPLHGHAGIWRARCEPICGDNARASPMVRRLQRTAPKRRKGLPVWVSLVLAGEVPDRNGEG